MTPSKRRHEIVSTAKVGVRPENRKELTLTIASLLDLIRKEEGCRTYTCYTETNDRDSFILIGEWETREAWNRHLHSDNFAVLIGSLKLLSNQPEIDFKLLSHAPAIEALTRARCEPNKEAQSPIFVN